MSLVGLTGQLRTFTNVKNIIVACDSQVALQWILQDPIKSRKNIFVSNRLNDIKKNGG